MSTEFITTHLTDLIHRIYSSIMSTEFKTTHLINYTPLTVTYLLYKCPVAKLGSKARNRI